MEFTAENIVESQVLSGDFEPLTTTDQSLFAEKINGFRQTLIGVAFRITCDNELSKDIVQDTILTALEKRADFRGESSLKTYLYRITINKSINAKNRKTGLINILERLSFEIPLFRSKHENAFEDRELIRAVFSGIPDAFRIPLMLAEFEDMSYEEIASTLNISINTVRSRIFRCREKLRKAYEKQDDKT